MYHHASTISTSVAQGYEVDVSDDLKKRFSTIGDLKPDQPTLLKYMVNEEWKLVGASVFKANCVSCHGANAAGQIGPNLTDEYWKNVKEIPNEIVLVAAYVASLRGQNLPGPRGQEGDLIPPWPAPPAKP
jgi:cytochrome c oxidase cbb3-type subunit 3